MHKWNYYFSECLNSPTLAADNSQLSTVPLPSTVPNPPYNVGSVFSYICEDSINFQLISSTGDAETVCQADGTFTLDLTPPTCIQISKKFCIIVI